MNIDLRSLTAFLRIVEAGSFSAAARQNGISQPALSRTIRLLEEQIGERLFDRDTRNLALTAVGHELKTLAERLISDFNGSLERVTEFARGTRGTVTVAAIPTLAATLVPKAVARLQASHPEVTVLIRDGFTAKITDAVVEGMVEFALTVRPPQNKELTYRPLLEDKFVAVAHRSFGLADKLEVDWAVFDQAPFIAFDKDSSIRMMTDAAFIRADLEVEPRYQCSELTTVGGMLAAQLGLTALPELTLAHLMTPELTSCPLVAPVVPRSLGIVRSSRRVLAPAAKAFLKHLLSEVRDSPYRVAGDFTGVAAP